MDNIDLIKKTFENQMGKTVYSVHEFDNVPNNSVYKIETKTRPYIFKIYSNRGWPEDGKIPFVYRKLTEYNIPHAKLFVFDREDINFPNGYMIEECLPGTTADKLALSEKETISLFEKLAVLVSQIHRIELINYGYTGGGTPAIWTTFSEFMYDILKDNVTNITARGIISFADLDKIRKVIYERLKPYDVFPSVLVHGDLSTKNILVHSNNITLIDWDDVQSLCWMADIARLTFWMKMNYDEHAADTYRNAFLNCYETKHDKNAFNEAEDILHVWYGLDNLNYFIDDPISEKVKILIQDSCNKCGI